MTPVGSLANGLIKTITGVLCEMDRDCLAAVPMQGPLIIVGNHLNWLDAPLVLSRTAPRPVYVMAKIESFQKQPLKFLFETWNGIPVRRGEADIDALRMGLDVLDQGGILVILPEGTRSNDGKLKRAKPGVVTLALRSGAPILPMVWYGHEALDDNLRRLRRTRVIVETGQAFTVDTGGRRIGREERQQIADEIMYQIAALLPATYRGEYADLDAATQAYLRFPSGSGASPADAKSGTGQKQKMVKRKGYGITAL